MHACTLACPMDNHKHYLSKQRTSPRSIIISSCTSPSKLSGNYFLLLLVVLLSLLHLRALISTTRTPFPFSISSYTSWSFSKHVRGNLHPEDAAPFIPLKDLRFAATAMDGNTWFMSAINDTYEEGEAQHLRFPSAASGGRLLCVRGNNTGDGTMNSYALAPKGSLPSNARVLPGLTFVSDSYYDYGNLFHGLTAMAPFVAWHTKERCVKPARWVLYKRGEVTYSLGLWVRTIVEAVFGGELNVERFENGGEAPTCFEDAVVFRHNQGAMGKERKEKVYDLMRCRSRAHCNISSGNSDDAGKAVRLTLFLRVGARSFKDDKAVIRIFDRECRKIEGCKLKVATPNNLTFCDQVKLMTETDILVSPHGAQLTNMFFMDKNSSVMEFFPSRWELAGVGRFVYEWVAGWSRMRHQGTWNDPQGEPCPGNVAAANCFSSFYKNQQIGHNETFFAGWAVRVLEEVRQQKLGTKRADGSYCSCG